ncbi:hypothetical protein GCM10011332_21680 [Terasakiella brassicae]|uniref:Small ribosomal subunit protein bS21 n=2 Tax=Terasakiellaceae TaxID=2813951 RepID=A0A917C148_9PROT|nr:hypothetical protein GCM10011332_21680 [Terasakiella brassicae]
MVETRFLLHEMKKDRDFGPDVIFYKEALTIVQVVVRDNNVDQALKALKKKMQREGVFREMKLRRHFEKPSEKKAREDAEAVRRARKLERKRLEREGF